MNRKFDGVLLEKVCTIEDQDKKRKRGNIDLSISGNVN